MPEVIDRRISFNGGEISPWTDPRLDLDKYRTGCRQLTNMRPNVYGGAFMRPGTVYMGAVKDADDFTIVVGFEFSVTTTLILEFGNLYLRFWTTGENAAQVESSPGVPYEIATPWTSDELLALQFAQQNDIVYITHPDHKPQILSRFANNSWTIASIVQEWPATRDINTTAVTLDPTAVTGAITVAASASTFHSGHVGSRWVMIHKRAEPKETININTASVGDTTNALFVLGDWSATTRTPDDGAGAWEVDIVVERSFNKSTWETVRTLTGTKSTIQVIVTGSELDPCWLRLKLTAKSGTIPSLYRGVVEAIDPNHYGIFDITSYSSATSVGATVVFELGGTGATKYWNEAAWSDYRGWPRSLSLHEQRLMFGGNDAQPQTVWGSIVNDYTNFRTGTDDDLGLSLSISSDQANGIQWLVSQESLVVGTTGSEWLIGTRDNAKSLTATNAAAKRSTNYGSAYIQAKPVSDVTLFVQRSARKVREFSFTFERDGYTAQDLTLLSEQITDSGIVQIAIQKNPETVMWCVTGDGDLIGITYERGQNVAGWFRHQTEGSVESVAIVSGEGEEDEMWLTVNRTIDGDTVRYVERLQPDSIRKLKDNEQSDLIYSDSAFVYNGAATDTVTGLDHLEAEEVQILADGSPLPRQTVLAGTITIPFEATKIIVGLPYTATIEPTFLETNDPGTTAKAGKKRIHRVHVELWRSLGLETSADAGTTWSAIDFRVPDDYMDASPPLFTGITEGILVEASTENQASLILRQTQPLPLNLLSLHIRYDLNSI